MELPEGWEWKKLGDVCEKAQYGYTTSARTKEEGPQFLRTTDISRGELNWNTVPYCDVLPKDEEKYLLKDGDVLFARAGSVGESIVVKNPPYSVFASYLIRFHPHENLLPEYLGYFAISKYFRAQLVGSTSGTTLSGINATNLSKLRIPLPPLPVQKKIVAILDRADRTRRLHKEVEGHIDEFLRSVFIEMFGDPVTNPKGWEMKNIKKLSEKFSDGPFGSNLKTEHYRKSGVRVIRLQNIGVGNFLDQDKTYVSMEHFRKLKKHTCRSGDILIGTLGDPNLRACILPKSIDIALNKADCVQCRPHKTIALPEYLCQLLNLPSALFMISRFLHGETRMRISMGNLSKLEIPIPPIDLQQQFSTIVESFEQLRQHHQQSSQETNVLFNALMQKAFQGELT